jgi:surfactin synthase thioesterase subunit
VTLANGLEDEFGVLVSIAKLISGPTINELADHLLELLVGAGRTSPEPVPALPPAVGADSSARPRAVAGQPELANGRGQWGADTRHPHSAARHAFNGSASVTAEDRIYPPAYGGSGEAPADDAHCNGIAADHPGAPLRHGTGAVAPRRSGRWLIAPQPNPHATARLFCFPYAGGGLASFRAWARVFGDTVEVVAVEPPGRGTRIDEPAIGELDVFVERLLPEMADWLDRPSAFFGHCLGGLTMFATLCALPEASAPFIRYAFACGVRPPHLLKRKGAFEDNLAYDMMLNRDFDAALPPYAQADEIFADIIRQFGIPAANRMLEIPELRAALLPTIRAEFGMAYNYEYRPVAPFSFPISSFVGDADPWVSREASAAWGDLTRARFNNHVCNGSHFLMADDGDYILETITKEFVDAARP